MILKKIQKEFEVPDPGEHLAVLADVQHLGVRPTNYGPKDQLRFKWFVQQNGTDGKQLGVIATYNNTLGDGASLVQAITDLTGNPPGDEFDTETLIGINSRLTLKMHNKKKDGAKFAKVIMISPPRKGDPVLVVPDWFVRASSGDKTPPATAAIVPAKVAAPTTTAQPKAAATSPSGGNRNKLDSPPEPSETEEWNPSDYDQATSFPPDNETPDADAA